MYFINGMYWLEPKVVTWRVMAGYGSKVAMYKVVKVNNKKSYALDVL